MQASTVRTLSIAFFVGLLTWGLYTLLAYIGMPIHGAVLLADPANQMVTAACGTENLICRGIYGFFPSLAHLGARALPFLSYGLFALLAYVLYLGWKWFQDNSDALYISWTPWKLLLLFVASVWLMFTVLSFGVDNGRSVRMYVEPRSDVYNVSPQGLEELTKDYQSLLSRGCLTEIGETQAGATLYNMGTGCVQMSFIARVIPQILFILLLLFELLIAGRAILTVLGYRTDRAMIEALLSAGAGACAWIVLLWLAAVAGIYTNTVGWLLIAAVPMLGYRHTIYWFQKFLHHRWDRQYGWFDLQIVLGFLLMSYIAVNFLTVVRPFPIGWDDLGSYLNRPRLLVSYGHFIFSMSPFDWTYLTSLGFLLFGYDSIVGATFSMMINWSAGLLAVIAIYVFTRAYLGKRAGILAALLYYALPLVGHFSFADMKIDNAVFFMGALAFFAMFLALMPPPADETAEIEVAGVVESDSGKPWWHPASFTDSSRLLLLCGAFAGFAFAIKSTAIMGILALAATIAGIGLGVPAFLGVIPLSFLVLLKFGGFNLSGMIARVSGVQVTPDQAFLPFATIALMLGVAGFGCAMYLRRDAIKPFLRTVALFAVGFAVATVPWLYHNNLEAAGPIPKRLELSSPNRLTPTMAPFGKDTVPDLGQQIRTLPPELALQRDHPTCSPTGGIEELDRYWGFSKGWGHYLTLPWRTVMNADSVGYYVTTSSALLLFPLILLLPYFWSRKGRWLRWLCGATAFVIVEWMFLANGVPWYGMAMFLGLMVGLEVMIVRAPDALSRWLGGFLVAMALSSCFAMRLWQFEQQRNILEYSFGKVSAGSLEQLTIPLYNDIRDEVVTRHEGLPDRPYLYRVGTFIPYFIPKNLEIIGINDHQLDMFNCLYQERDPAITLRRLKALGFNSIIFDTNTATIEQDQNGSLHKKVNAFQQFVNTQALGLQVLVNDVNAGVAFILIP